MLLRSRFILDSLFGILLSVGLVNAAASDLEATLATAAHPLQVDGGGLAPLLQAAGAARVVLLGEASHGTHEFYTWRSRLSRELIEGGQVAFVAIEGDTATLAALDRYVRHDPEAPVSARAALAGITHWPSWVWANAELADFAEWLRQFNARRPAAQRVAIHGLDLYAITGALAALEAFYRRHAPSSIAPVLGLQQGFAPFHGRVSAYAGAVLTSGRSLRPDALKLVDDLAGRYRQSPADSRDKTFLALQHARAVAAGLGYLEALPGPPMRSANLRSRHFGLTLHRLLGHHGNDSRAIVWAHNTHVGDARATDGRFVGELSLGQLARQRLGENAVFIVGFGTGVGEVLAARRWGEPCETLPTPLPRADSLEAAMLAGGTRERFWLFQPEAPVTRLLGRWIAHRAIGTTYDPAHEARQNYVPTQTAERYDAFVFLPRTRPLHALDWPSGSARCSRGNSE